MKVNEICVTECVCFCMLSHRCVCLICCNVDYEGHSGGRRASLRVHLWLHVCLQIGYWDMENESEQHGHTGLFWSLHPSLSPSHALSVLDCTLTPPPLPFSNFPPPLFSLSLHHLSFFPLPDISDISAAISAKSDRPTTLLISYLC